MVPAGPGAPLPGPGYPEWDGHYGASVRPWGASGDDHWRQHRYSQSSQGQSTTGMPFVTSPTPEPASMYPETYAEVQKEKTGDHQPRRSRSHLDPSCGIGWRQRHRRRLRQLPQ